MLRLIPIVLLIGYFAASGTKSRGFYRQQLELVHPAQIAETFAVVALVFWQLVGPALGVWGILGALWIGNVLFQGLVNPPGVGCIDENEPWWFDLWGIRVPKILLLSLWGRWRYLQLALGALSILYELSR